MSVIEEALRRAQDPILSEAEGSPATPPPSRAGASRERPLVLAHSTPGPDVSPLSRWARPFPSRALVAALTIGGIAAVLIIGGTAWRRMSSTPHPMPPPASASTVDEARPTRAPSSVVPATAERGATASRQAFLLTGVAEGNGEPYALINERIVRVGEAVGDATLVRVANGSVTLRHANGTETVLQVPR